ncbi:MAG TPA: hypothetical protein VFI30_04650 [Nocardioidaceae bacterium]|nr:hypothetical protein [Nocardioidaceae bacterium]
MYEPTDAAELTSKVMSDTYMFNQGVIQNVDTSWLGFWNGHQTDHFDVVHGYTNYGSDVKIAEEWDSYFTFGYYPAYGDPYGKHTQQVTISGHTGEFEAVHNSPTERMVV